MAPSESETGQSPRRPPEIAGRFGVLAKTAREWFQSWIAAGLLEPVPTRGGEGDENDTVTHINWYG